MAQPRAQRDPSLLHNQIAALKREVALRERNYPRWIADNRMGKLEADYEIAVFKALLARLEAEALKGQLHL